VLLPRYRAILQVEPVNAADLKKIRLIQADFHSSLPAIRALCERALVENRDDKHAVLAMLSGIAAADELNSLGWLLTFGKEGFFNCSLCGWRHEYILYGDRLAFYAYGNNHDTRSRLDYDEKAPNRCDGFVSSAQGNEIFAPQVVALLALADRASNPEPALLLRNFLGHFRCGKCGGQSPLQAD
jgi:hypothetical protein